MSAMVEKWQFRQTHFLSLKKIKEIQIFRSILVGRELAVSGAVSLGWLEKDSLPQVLKGLENNKVQKDNTTKEEKLVNIPVLPT